MLGETGLISIFARRETLPPGHWVEQLRSATKEVDLMDYTLFTWTKRHDSPLFQPYQQEFNLLWKLNVPPSQVKVVP
jgi:hypothetical protein